MIGLGWIAAPVNYNVSPLILEQLLQRLYRLVGEGNENNNNDIGGKQFMMGVSIQYLTTAREMKKKYVTV